MAQKKFTQAQWRDINELLESLSDQELEESYGLPERRDRSVVLGSFNIRKLGKVTGRSEQAWNLLGRICDRFDLLAVQEVMDDLSGVRELMNRMVGTDFGLVTSDTTGVFPGERGNAERLAFIFKWTRVRRTELASDITYDRSRVVNTLYAGREQFADAFSEHEQKLKTWRESCREAVAAGKDKPDRPPIELPGFVTFIRQPHCASFQVLAHGEEDDYEFLVVNAHLLYGNNKMERRMEFDALIDWLTIRAKKRKTTYYDNLLMMGDCNLEFETTGIIRAEIDDHLRELNQTALRSMRAAKVNFPLLTPHPVWGELKTAARQHETYDQIAIFSHDTRLPRSDANEDAGTVIDGYDYGVFNFTDLFAEAIHGKKYAQLTKAKKDDLINRCQHDVSDHMPVWFRLPIPTWAPGSRSIGCGLALKSSWPTSRIWC